MVGTLTATISAYPSEPPRSVVTDRFNPWAQDGGGGSVASFFCVRFDVVIVIRGRGGTAKKLVEREEKKNGTEITVMALGVGWPRDLMAKVGISDITWRRWWWPSLEDFWCIPYRVGEDGRKQQF